MDHKSRNLYGMLLVILAVSVVFLPVIGFEFLNYDDNLNVSNNPLVCDFSWASIQRFWSHPYEYLYIPVTYSVWGGLAGLSALFTDGPTMPPDPAFFHTANLLVHLFSVLIFFRILRRLLKDVRAAVAGALLFGLHPVQVEAVAWITGMKDLLGGLFSLLALESYLLYTAVPGGAKRQLALRRYGLASLFFILALLSKPSSVTVPLLVGVVGLFCLDRPLKLLASELLPWLLLTIPALLVTRWAQPDAAQIFDFSLWQRILVAGDALSFYLGKLCWPATVAPDYGRSPSQVLGQGWEYVTLLPPLGILGMLWKWRAPWLRAGVLIFFLALTPVLGLVPFNFQKISTVADRYLYLSMLGPGFLTAWLLFRFRSKQITVLVFALLALLALQSRLALRHWHDSFTFNRHALMVNPRSYFAYLNLGVAYSDAGNFLEALSAYQRAIELTPDEADAYFNLGNLYSRKGMAKEALAYYQQSLGRIPRSYGRVYRKIGESHASLGEYDQALANYKLALYHFRLAKAGSYELAKVHVVIGVIYKNMGRIDEAIGAYRQALLVYPDFAEALNNLGAVYEEQGRSAEAEESYRLAVARKPTLAEPYNNLGLVYLDRHQTEEAITLFRKAVELAPGQPALINNLGNAYLALGQYDAALAAFQQALKNDPGFAPAMSGLARTYRRLGRDDLAGPYSAKAETLGYNEPPDIPGRARPGGIARP